MNKLTLLTLCGVFLILVTGCSNVFNTIPKDTVMVKKISKEHENDEVQYDGVLSQEAVKTLSLNAVNKYLDEDLTMDELQFELMAIDQNKLRDLLREARDDVGPQPVRTQGNELEYQAGVEHISGGLFFTTLTNLTDPDEAYDIVLNARDGDVIKVSRVQTRPNISGSSAEVNPVTDTAAKFIEAHGSYPLSELSLNENMTRWGTIVELYYTSEDGNALNYCVMVSLRRNEIVGFSKDVMALLSYYSSL